jgi:hypothetical protein
MYKCALEFVTHYSARGIPYRVQEDTSVIPIPQAYLDCCEYIYKTRVDAEAGALTGGSGFFVGAKLEENKDSTQLYVVTAKHVLRGMEHPVLRVNVAEGGVDYLTTDRASWVGHPDGDDLAVCQIEIEYGKYSMRCAFVEDFVDYRKNSLLYPGDEVFMVGRFFSHEGKQQNAPSVRFGNISMLAMETMKTFEDYDQRTFLVEQRSLPGYSGSPVFVFLDPSQPRPPMFISKTMKRYLRVQRLRKLPCLCGMSKSTQEWRASFQHGVSRILSIARSSLCTEGKKISAFRSKRELPVIKVRFRARRKGGHPDQQDVRCLSQRVRNLPVL